ncbi:MAG: hypothetical protein RBU25_12760 [Lentisphaeria bacterium]|nr:hypothetical protein [Lentisphaeria bacterium]
MKVHHRKLIPAIVVVLGAAGAGLAWFFFNLFLLSSASSSMPTGDEWAVAERLVHAAIAAYEAAPKTPNGPCMSVSLKPSRASFDILIGEVTEESLQDCLLTAMRQAFPEKPPSPRRFRALFLGSGPDRKPLRTELLSWRPTPPADKSGGGEHAMDRRDANGPPQGKERPE